MEPALSGVTQARGLDEMSRAAEGGQSKLVGYKIFLALKEVPPLFSLSDASTNAFERGREREKWDGRPKVREKRIQDHLESSLHNIGTTWRVDIDAINTKHR